MSLEQTACEDLKAFERRLTEVIACLQPSTTRWRIVLIIVSACVAAGAGQWLTDPLTRVIPLSQSLSNHPFFIVATVMLIFFLFVSGVSLWFLKELVPSSVFPISRRVAFFKLIVSVIIFLLGVHKRVVAASLITTRTREVLCDFNMSCDDTGKLILKPRPTNVT